MTFVACMYAAALSPVVSACAVLVIAEVQVLSVACSSMLER